MYLIIESSAFGQEGARHKKTNRALLALTYRSHAILLSINAQIIHWPRVDARYSAGRMVMHLMNTDADSINHPVWQESTCLENAIGNIAESI